MRVHGTIIAAIAGFLLSWQTVWIFRSGMLGGVPWPLATIGVYASDVVLLIAAIFGIARMWRGGDLPPTPQRHEFEISNLKSVVGGRGSRRLLIALAAIVIVAIVNTRISADPWLSAVGWTRLIAFFLAIAGIPSWSVPARRAFLAGFLVAMLGHVVLAFLQFATGHGFASTLLGTAAHDAFVRGDAVVETAGGRWLRAYGGFPHPNILGTALLVAAAALSVIATRTQQQAVPENDDRSFLVSTLMPIVGVVLLIFALVLTFSRSALLGLAILFIVCVCQRAMRHLALTGAMVAAIGIALTWSFWVPRVAITNANEMRSMSERTIASEQAIGFLRIPNTALLGTGLHAMPQTSVAIDPVANPYYSAQPVHNVPLLALAEVGIVGIVALVFALITLTRQGQSSRFQILDSRFSPWLALLPPFLLDHFFWSLPIGLALLFALAVSASFDNSRPFVYGAGALD